MIHPLNARRWHCTGLAVLLAVPLFAVTAPTAQAAPSDPPTASSMYSADEQLALTQARKSGSKVSVASKTTETTLVEANPAGGFTLTTSQLPTRTLKDGVWKDLDTSLTVGSDGRIHPSLTIPDLSFSNGGSGALAITGRGGATVNVTLPTKLPTPTLAGNILTYSDVLPGVSLQLTVSGTGYVETWIVKDATAARHPALAALTAQIDVTGGTAQNNSDGSTVITSNGQPVLRSAPALAWDSRGKTSAQTPGDNQRPETVTIAGRQTTPTSTSYKRTINTASDLLQGSNTVYPVYIDPPWDASTAGISFAVVTDTGWKYNNTTSPSNELRVGYCQYVECNGTWLARSFFQFNTSTLNVLHNGNRPTLTKVGVNVHQTRNVVSAATTVNLYSASDIPTGWAGNPVSLLGGANLAGDDTYYTFGDGALKTYAQNAVNQGAQALTFALLSGSEAKTSSNYGYKRFSNNPVLQVDYLYEPDQPTTPVVTPSPNCNTYITTKRPSFVSNFIDFNGGLSQLIYRVTNTTTNTMVGENTINVSNSAAAMNYNYQWPTDLPDGAYRIETYAKGTSAGVTLTGPLSAPAYFKIGTQKPALPTLTRLSTSAKSVIVTAPTGTAGFTYSWSGSTLLTGNTLACSGPSVAATSGFLTAKQYTNAILNSGTAAYAGAGVEIPIPSDITGPATLTVAAIDAAGNQSDPATLSNLIPTGITYTYQVEDAKLSAAPHGLTATDALSADLVGGKGQRYTPGPTCAAVGDCYVDYQIPIPGGASGQWEIDVTGLATTENGTPTDQVKFETTPFLTPPVYLKVGSVSYFPSGSVASGAQKKTVYKINAPTTDQTFALRAVPQKANLTTINPFIFDTFKVVNLPGTATLNTTATDAGAFVPIIANGRIFNTVTDAAPLSANGTRTIQIGGATVGDTTIPADATAVMINLTTTAPAAAGNLAVYPTGTAQPGTSNLNYTAGQTMANLATIPLQSPGATSGSITIANNSIGTTHAIIDVVGYYLGGTPTAAGSFQPLAAAQRAYDTRTTDGKIPANTSRPISVAPHVPAGAAAVIANITPIPDAAGSFSAQKPGVVNHLLTNQSLVAGRVSPVLVIAPLDANAAFTIDNVSLGASHYIVDVQGYVVGGTVNTAHAGLYRPITPYRITDTRFTGGGIAAPYGGVLISTETPVGTLVAAVTTTGGAQPGFLTASSPADLTPTTTSSLNYANATISNLIASKASDQPTTMITNYAGSTHIIVDAFGYYTSGRP